MSGGENPASRPTPAELARQQRSAELALAEEVNQAEQLKDPTDWEAAMRAGVERFEATTDGPRIKEIYEQITALPQDQREDAYDKATKLLSPQARDALITYGSAREDLDAHTSGDASGAAATNEPLTGRARRRAEDARGGKGHRDDGASGAGRKRDRNDNERGGGGDGPSGPSDPPAAERSRSHEALRIESGVAERVGYTHLENEDRAVRDDGLKVYGAIDGIGGYAGGAKAAEAVRGAAIGFLAENKGRFTPETGADLMRDMFRSAHGAVTETAKTAIAEEKDKAKGNPLLEKDAEAYGDMGAVAAIGHVFEYDGKTYVAVGIVGDAKFIKYNPDETGRVESTEECSPAEPNMVINSIQHGREMKLNQFNVYELKAGDRLAFLTDGITGDWEEQRLRPGEVEHALSLSTAQESADNFLEITSALPRKINDDATAVVVRTGEGEMAAAGGSRSTADEVAEATARLMARYGIGENGEPVGADAAGSAPTAGEHGGTEKTPEARIAELEAENGTLRRKVADLEAKLSELNNNIAGLNSQIASLNERLRQNGVPVPGTENDSIDPETGQPRHEARRVMTDPEKEKIARRFAQLVQAQQVELLEGMAGVVDGHRLIEFNVSIAEQARKYAVGAAEKVAALGISYADFENAIRPRTSEEAERAGAYDNIVSRSSDTPGASAERARVYDDAVRLPEGWYRNNPPYGGDWGSSAPLDLSTREGRESVRDSRWTRWTDRVRAWRRADAAADAAEAAGAPVDVDDLIAQYNALAPDVRTNAPEISTREGRDRVRAAVFRSMARRGMGSAATFAVAASPYANIVSNMM